MVRMDGEGIGLNTLEREGAPPCPRCGSALAVIGSQCVCLDCAYQEAYLPRTLLVENRSPDAPEGEPSSALWLPPRRRKGGVTTPLGFQAGFSCPRVCGGTLEEQAGQLSCTNCDFHYPESETSHVEDPSRSPHGIPSSPKNRLTESSVTSLRSASGDTDEEVQALRQEVERLKTENSQLMKLVVDLLQQLPRKVDESGAENVEDESLSVEMEVPPPPQPVATASEEAPWWRRRG